jgi:hypothetical protein
MYKQMDGQTHGRANKERIIKRQTDRQSGERVKKKSNRTTEKPMPIFA